MVHGQGGRLIASRIVNRTATFVFVIGERHFGTVMVYAAGPHAANYTFTSALPVQLLKSLVPTLLPLLESRAPEAPLPAVTWAAAYQNLNTPWLAQPLPPALPFSRAPMRTSRPALR